VVRRGGVSVWTSGGLAHRFGLGNHLNRLNRTESAKFRVGFRSQRNTSASRLHAERMMAARPGSATASAASAGENQRSSRSSFSGQVFSCLRTSRG